MNEYLFKSMIIGPEINLEEISKHFGINKKYKWEEPLKLNEKLLKGVINQPEEKMAYLYHFGSIVTINMEYHEIQDVIQYLKGIDTNLKNNTTFSYIEDFKLEKNPDIEYELNYDSVVLKSPEEYHISMISTILAKSVALKKIEYDIDILLDEIENVIEFLDTGKLGLSDTQLAKMSGKILRFKYTTISYIMLLEKPDIAWVNEGAEDFFVNMQKLYELHDRYEKIRHKTEVLLDITEVFSSLSHAKRGNKLEWIVIVLIFIELILPIVNIILK